MWTNISNLQKNLESTDDILQWVRFMATPVIVPSDDADEDALYASSSLPTVVLRAKEQLESFELAARKLRSNASWIFVNTSDVEPQINILHRLEEPIHLSGGGLDKAGMLDLFTQHRFPLVGRLDSANLESYLDSKTGLISCIFGNVSTTQDLDALHHRYRAMLAEVGEHVRGKFLVTYVDSLQLGSTIENYGVKTLPAVVVQKIAGAKQKYIYAGKFATAHIIEFVKKVGSGMVKAKVKSEPAPKSKNNRGPVRQVVGSTLQKECSTPDKDVLLEVYAPWCEHCQKLEPEYDKLAERVKVHGLERFVKIAKMDGTANDSPMESLVWDGFPSIFLFKAGMENQKPLQYQGKLTASGLWELITTEGSNMYEIQDELEKNEAKMEL